jgi:predicted oxidoreductase
VEKTRVKEEALEAEKHGKVKDFGVSNAVLQSLKPAMELDYPFSRREMPISISLAKRIIKRQNR